MENNTVTLVLEGEIPLEQFAKAISDFRELVAALSEEAGNPALDWVIDDLQVSSSVATVRCNDDAAIVTAVVSGYADVGASLENNAPIKHSPRVTTAARNIVAIDTPRINAVRFETAVRDAVVQLQQGKVVPIREHDKLLVAPTPNRMSKVAPAFGAVQGRIQTLTNRGGLRFTLYDLIHDKAVGCYFSEGKEDLIRDLWGKLATVEGIVTRDPINGRPISVREVSEIIPQAEGRGSQYWEARGVAPAKNGLLPEDAIRRSRDAE